MRRMQEMYIHIYTGLNLKSDMLYISPNVVALTASTASFQSFTLPLFSISVLLYTSSNCVASFTPPLHNYSSVMLLLFSITLLPCTPSQLQSCMCCHTSPVSNFCCVHPLLPLPQTITRMTEEVSREHPDKYITVEFMYLDLSLASVHSLKRFTEDLI